MAIHNAATVKKFTALLLKKLQETNFNYARNALNGGYTFEEKIRYY